jgi:hypothetical protein
MRKATRTCPGRRSSGRRLRQMVLRISCYDVYKAEHFPRSSFAYAPDISPAPAALALVVLAVFTLSACFDMESRKQRHFDRGVELFEAGDDVRARLEFRNVLQIDDRYAAGWYWLGRVEERRGEFRRALRELQPGGRTGRIPCRGAGAPRADLCAGRRRGKRRTGQRGGAGARAGGCGCTDASGRGAAGAGNRAGAEEDARTALERQPGHAAASVLMAENLDRAGRPAGRDFAAGACDRDQRGRPGVAPDSRWAPRLRR